METMWSPYKAELGKANLGMRQAGLCSWVTGKDVRRRQNLESLGGDRYRERRVGKRRWNDKNGKSL